MASFQDFMKKKIAVAPDAVVERSNSRAAKLSERAEERPGTDDDFKNWWASNAQNTGATPLRPPRLDLGEDSDVSDDESDGEYNPSTPPASSARKSPPRTATKSPPPREDAPSVVHNLSFAAPRVVPPPVAHGPGSLEELDALAQEETCEISQRMREAQPSLYGTGLASDTGSTDHLDTMTSGWRGDTHSDGTTAPAAATATPTATRRPATESDLGRPISRLGAAIAEALVPVNPTVRDAPRRWWAVKTKKGAIVRAGLELDSAHVSNLEHSLEILVDGTGETHDGKARLRIIVPYAGWSSEACFKQLPVGHRPTQTFDEFMAAQTNRQTRPAL